MKKDLKDIGIDLTRNQISKVIKNDLGKVLGAKWNELKKDRKEYLALKQVMMREGIFLEGVATFLNPEFPNWQIDLTMKKETAEGKVHYIVLVLGSRRN